MVGAQALVTTGNTVSTVPPASGSSQDSHKPQALQPTNSNCITLELMPSALLEQVCIDVNSMRSKRNYARLARRARGEDTSDDEDMITKTGLSSLFMHPSATALPINQASTSNLNLWAFTDEDASKNKQHSILHTVPAQLICMFKAHVYCPLTCFLPENMVRIRVEQNVKSHKSLIMRPCRIIDENNFMDERDLDFLQFTQAYSNFLRCMEACMPANSNLPLAWGKHFTRAMQDSRDNFRVYLYMDIRMRQELVDAPFAPDVNSTRYAEAFQIAFRKVQEEKINAQINEAVRSCISSYASSGNRGTRYHPYSSSGNNYRDDRGANGGSFRGQCGYSSGRGHDSSPSDRTFRHKNSKP